MTVAWPHYACVPLSKRRQHHLARSTCAAAFKTCAPRHSAPTWCASQGIALPTRSSRKGLARADGLDAADHLLYVRGSVCTRVCDRVLRRRHGTTTWSVRIRFAAHLIPAPLSSAPTHLALQPRPAPTNYPQTTNQQPIANRCALSALRCALRCRSDAAQMPLRCRSDAAQMPLRCRPSPYEEAAHGVAAAVALRADRVGQVVARSPSTSADMFANCSSTTPAPMEAVEG
jgi:hypothetical protein